MKKVITALMLLVASAAQAAPINLIKNGSFESNSIGNGTWTIKSALDNWTVGQLGAEVRNNYVGTAQNGKNFLELDTTGNSWISQVVNTVAGGQYNLSFYYAARANTSASTNGIDVFWNGSLLKHVEANNTGSNQNWIKIDLSMFGAGNLSTLQFKAAGTSDSLGGSLDNVSLTAVPEPGTLAIFGLGLGLLGASVRRRKN